MSDIVTIYYDKSPLVIVKNVPKWADLAKMLDVYAEKYAFERSKLTAAFWHCGIEYGDLDIN